MSLRPRAGTLTQNTVDTKWTPFLKFWKATTIEDEGYGQGPESLERRKPLMEGIINTLRIEERARLQKLIRDNPGIDCNLRHPNIGELKKFLVDVAILMDIPKKEIDEYVYEGTDVDRCSRELERLWAPREAVLRAEREWIAEERRKERKGKGKKKAGESSKSSSGSEGAI